MKIAALPDNEVERLTSLYGYSILDTLEEQDYDEITALASQICQAPIALISFVDKDRQFYKSRLGLDATGSPRDYSFCSHAINEPDNLFIIEDSTKDERFFDHHFVTGNPNIAFYAAVTLLSSQGFALGTLCVIDQKPRQLSPSQIQALQILGKQVMFQLELKRKVAELDKKNANLKQFAYVLSHDIKNPVNNIFLTAEILKNEFSSQITPEALRLIGFMGSASVKINQLVDGVLSYYYSGNNIEFEKIELSEFLNSVIELINPSNDVVFNLPEKTDIAIYSNKILLQQIYMNLITNAIKYNDNDIPQITLGFWEDDIYYHFSVKDNGRGIAEDNLQKIFTVFTNLKTNDRAGNVGTGIGLATVKQLVEKLEGEIDIVSKVGEGTTFNFSIMKTPETHSKMDVS